VAAQVGNDEVTHRGVEIGVPETQAGIEQRNDEPTGDAANDVAVRPGPALPAIRFEGSERAKF
jgi:hypothetical protein